jgi:hypothetical protein
MANWFKIAQINDVKIKYHPSGSFFILHKNTKPGEGPWRISYFNEKGRGYVHRDFSTHDQALTIFNTTYGFLDPQTEEQNELV